MASTTLFEVNRSDSCENCFASAQFHLKNPFGVYYRGIPSERTVSYYEWHNKPMTTDVMMCREFVTSNNVTLDHDDLYRAIARV